MKQGKISKGIIESLNISTHKGVIKKPVFQAAIDETGIQQDAHSGQWHRQVSLLDSESIADFSEKFKKTVIPGEFAENITTKGIDFKEVCLFDSFKINDVELIVTQIGKECHGNTCEIFKKTGACIMPKKGIFTKVFKTGTIKTNHEIKHIHRILQFHIITLSDRASSGVYQDKSGLIVSAFVNDFFKEKPYHINICHTIIPDSKKLFKKALKLAVIKNCDVIISTGSTGIGPKDIAPDVVLDFADRIIPGVMEFIRNKYGEKYPNALLSRSIAALAGTTLIFTLPGSVKAVKEYLKEIFKSLEHSLFMIQGIDIH